MKHIFWIMCLWLLASCSESREEAMLRLVNEWGTGANCRWNSTYIICDGIGTREGCPCGSHEW